MPNTMLSSLSSTLNLSAREEGARTLGESEPAVSRGLELAMAAVFAGLNRQTDQPDAMRQLIDLASKTPSDVGSAVNTAQLTNPNSPLISSGQTLLSSVLGQGQGTTLSAVSRESGLRATSAAHVLALAAHSVLSLIGARVRGEGMTAASLAAILQSEASGIPGSFPSGFDEPTAAASRSVQTGSTVTRRIEIDPVIAQTVRKEKRRSLWVWLLPFLLILLGFLHWFLFRSQPASVAETPVSTPVKTPAPAIPVAPAASDSGSIVPRQLVDSTTLHIPERSVEGRLLAFIRDPAQKLNRASWFDFDRLLFSTGAATLQPQALEQLHNIAAILKAYRATYLTIGGYTDNTGDAAKNRELSKERANNVSAELVKLGVAKDRLLAQGYGEQHPVGDNATEAGRAQNRRVSLLVTKK
jgi:OOP family OmpA-OmpF porin